MALLVVDDTWSSGITLAQNEVWQCVSGRALVSFEGSPGAYEGYVLLLHFTIEIASGKTVKVRAVENNTAIYRGAPT